MSGIFFSRVYIKSDTLLSNGYFPEQDAKTENHFLAHVLVQYLLTIVLLRVLYLYRTCDIPTHSLRYCGQIALHNLSMPLKKKQLLNAYFLVPPNSTSTSALKYVIRLKGFRRKLRSIMQQITCYDAIEWSSMITKAYWSTIVKSHFCVEEGEGRRKYYSECRNYRGSDLTGGGAA